MAGAQSLSRTLVSVFAPSGRSAEFYGFFSLAGRTSSIIGPGVMGAAATGISLWVMKMFSRAELVSPTDPVALDISEKIGHRFAIISMIFFILVGIIPLLFVDEEKGKLAAKQSGLAE
jgi:UMF1 family MFS transporter